MKIGIIVQGSSDKAFLTGLRNRWCKGAEIETLGYRGTKLSPRKYPQACKEGRLKGCNVIIILTDTDNNDLGEVLKAEKRYIPDDMQDMVIMGVAERNIECWICADADYVANNFPCTAKDLRVNDPKTSFQAAIKITRDDKKEDEIADLVGNYPSLQPMLKMPSFKRFYNDARAFAMQNGCIIPNERNKLD